MRIGAIIQARMTSRRLPGKVMRPIGGRPLLQYHLDRVQACRELDGITVATSTDPSDDVIEAWCRRAGIRCRRGSLYDVAARFAWTAHNERLDAFVRLCGDSPFIDPRLVDRLVASARAEHADVVTNVHPRSFPPGQSVEVVDTVAFTAAERKMTDTRDREHVTRWFYRHTQRYRIRNVTSDRDYGALSLVVDTTEDLDRTETLLSSLEKPHWEYGLDALAALQQPAVR